MRVNKDTQALIIRLVYPEIPGGGNSRANIFLKGN